MVAVELVKIGVADGATGDDALLGQAVGGVADPLMGAVADDPLELAAGHLGFRAREYAQYVPIQRRSHGLQRSTEVHAETITTDGYYSCRSATIVAKTHGDAAGSSGCLAIRDSAREATVGRYDAGPTPT